MSMKVNKILVSDSKHTYKPIGMLKRQHEHKLNLG